MPEDQNNFYRSQFFQELDKRFSRMEEHQINEDKANKEFRAEVERRFDTIDAKLNYIYAFAGGISIASVFVIEWVKKKMF